MDFRVVGANITLYSLINCSHKTAGWAEKQLSFISVDVSYGLPMIKKLSDEPLRS